MAAKSAGILIFRTINGHTEFLLAHPGGPYWKNKQAGAWTIPKGEIHDGEEPINAAIRELEEETGLEVERDKLIDLGTVKQKGGKVVYGFGYRTKMDKIPPVSCNKVEIEWPPKTGRIQLYPEIDDLRFFPVNEAIEKINPAQREFLQLLDLRETSK